MSTASESHSPARSSGLLSKARRSRRKDADRNSTISNGSDGAHGLRGKLEGVIDKLKHQDGSDDEDGEGGGLKKLIPKGLPIGSKRRRRKEEEADAERLAEEAARGRSVAERGTLGNYADEGISPGASGDGSSLITYESENEEPSAIPPPLSSHDSHRGYLTTSSPLIKSTTLPGGTQSELMLDGAGKAATFPLQFDTTSNTQSSPNLTEGLRAIDGVYNRSPSPNGRLRDAITTRRSPNTSPERKEVLEAPKDGSISSRRGSVASRIGAIFPGKEAILPASLTSPSRTAKGPRPIDTNSRPQTPEGGEAKAPVIVNTPPTPTEPYTPISGQEGGRTSPITSAGSNVVVSPSGNMISHRRNRSGSATLIPSKLSNITSAPLTPTPENPTTPGGSNQTGFFSTVFSAAQNAANTLSNSIANTSLAPGKGAKGAPQEAKHIDDDVEVETATGEKMEHGDIAEQKEPAVKTLGQGDLSLSHLGIEETNSVAETPVTPKFPDTEGHRSRSNSINPESNRQSANAWIPDAAEGGAFTTAEDLTTQVRPRSVFEPMLRGDQTPPQTAADAKSGVKRSGSIRSILPDAPRRHRGSSAATGTTIGAAIAAAHTSVAHPAAAGSTPKLTGFAVASKKRNRDFHQLFRSVPEDDYLIEDYSCALQREILAHGRLYVSEGHLCFSSNIFGWVTTLVMSFDEIVSIEKRNTALLFKNGLMISTLHAKNIFASFTSRDSTYDLIVGIWKLGHPSLRSSLNGVRIDETGGGDKTERIDAPESAHGSESESGSDDGEVYDEDDEEEDGMSFTQAGEGSVSGSDGVPEKVASRKPSAAVMAANGTAAGAGAGKEGTPTAAMGFPGPPTHAPTTCSDQDTHYDKILADEVIPAPLGKIYDLMFGPASVSWMAGFLTNVLKCQDFTSDDKKGLTSENKVRTSTYIKPLNASLGPKQTKCVVTENLDSLDLEKAVSVTISTQTPDVPSGNVFTTKTKYCLMWAEDNHTRLLMNYTVEWTGKSWLKGPIEKGATDGQTQYGKDIIAALRAAVSSKSPRGTGAVPVGKKRKGGRKEKSRSAPGGMDGSSDSKTPTTAKSGDWGLFEPLHGPLGPVVDIVGPLFGGNILYGLLGALLVAAYFSLRGGGGSRGGVGRHHSSSFSRDVYLSAPERLAAYEELWRGEESELWSWLEERTGMEGLMPAAAPGAGVVARGEMARGLESKMGREEADPVHVEEAIRVTEEKLRVLRGVVEKRKGVKGGNGNGEKKGDDAAGAAAGALTESVKEGVAAATEALVEEVNAAIRDL